MTVYVRVEGNRETQLDWVAGVFSTLEAAQDGQTGWESHTDPRTGRASWYLEDVPLGDYWVAIEAWPVTGKPSSHA